jgi:hypothetical protein
MARERRDRIDAYRHDTTGEIAPAHLIGETAGGYDLYSFEEGWHPVAQLEDESYVHSTRIRSDRDGNWIASTKGGVPSYRQMGGIATGV